MAIIFKIPKLLQDKTEGKALMDVQGGCVFDCIADLVRRYPGLKGMILDAEDNVLLKWMIYINNSSAVSSNVLSYQVRDGDVITLMPMIAGG
jgi:molybdopterin synthase sulfur carrier subunit